MATTHNFDFDGKIALVTGGTSGIGRAIAQKLAESGAQVIVNSESEADCEKTVEEILGQGFLAAIQRTMRPT